MLSSCTSKVNGHDIKTPPETFSNIHLDHSAGIEKKYLCIEVSIKDTHNFRIQSRKMHVGKGGTGGLIQRVVKGIYRPTIEYKTSAFASFVSRITILKTKTLN